MDTDPTAPLDEDYWYALLKYVDEHSDDIEYDEYSDQDYHHISDRLEDN